MTLRTAIAALLGSDPSADPASVADALATEGHDDLPPELFGTALTNYADLAPVAEADALAPIVTRTGPVPFDDEDLPPIEGDLPADAYALFEAVAPAVPADETAAEETGLDFEDPSTSTEPPVETEVGPTEEPTGFGAGQTGDGADDETFDELAEIGADDELLADFARGAMVESSPSEAATEIDLVEGPTTDLFNSDFTDVVDQPNDVDPDDLDAELE